jgi:hypothetical protein
MDAIVLEIIPVKIAAASLSGYTQPPIDADDSRLCMDCG